MKSKANSQWHHDPLIMVFPEFPNFSTQISISWGHCPSQAKLGELVIKNQELKQLLGNLSYFDFREEKQRLKFSAWYKSHRHFVKKNTRIIEFNRLRFIHKPSKFKSWTWGGFFHPFIQFFTPSINPCLLGIQSRRHRHVKNRKLTNDSHCSCAKCMGR